MAGDFSESTVLVVNALMTSMAAYFRIDVKVK